MTPIPTNACYRFGGFALDFASRRLYRDGTAVTCPWRCFEMLVLLVEAQGAVVDREVLFRKLWPGVEVEETSLTKVVSQLRRILSEADANSEYIETVPRLGYRLAIPVVIGQLADTVVASPAFSKRSRRYLQTWAAAAAGILIACLAGGWAWEWLRITREAEGYYQEGRRLRREGGPNAIRGAVENYRRATQRNPRNAEYFAALAQTLGSVPSPGLADWSAAREAAERAVQLNPANASGHAVLGFTLFSRFWDWDQGEVHLLQAIKLKGSDSGLRGYLAMFYATQGRTEDALREADEAVRIDPYFATGHQIRSLVLFFNRRYSESVHAAGRALAIDGEHQGALDRRAIAQLASGRDKDALEDWILVVWKEGAAVIRAAHDEGGIRRALNKLLEYTSAGRIRLNHSYRRANWRLYLGDVPGAIDELEAALEFRHFNLMYAAVDPSFERLRFDPRFQRIIKAMRLSHAVERVTSRNHDMVSPTRTATSGSEFGHDRR